MIFYSKWEHGSRKIEIDETRKVYIIEGNQFSSWREAYQFLSGRKTTVSLERYRKPFKHSDAYQFRLETLPKQTGIDLKKYHVDIEKLVRSYISKRGMSYDIQDVLQEVYLGLLVRNRGKCPWDKKKSSLGNYVYMVTSCILSNYHNKNKKHLYADLENQDTLQSENLDQTHLLETDLKNWVLQQIEPSERISYEKVLDLMIAGNKIREISEKLGVSQGSVSKKALKLKSLISQWKTNEGNHHVIG